jgi:hypothetical protein
MAEPLTEKQKNASDLASATKAVRRIIDDLSDRRGLGYEWGEIDDSTQEEIRKKWRDLILREFGYDI